MYYPLRDQKGHITPTTNSYNYCSVPSSPSMTEATTKKKMFARKPANAIGNLVPEKKKSTFDQSLQALTLIRLPTEGNKSIAKPAEPAEWKQRERALDVSHDGPIKTEGSLTKYRQVFFSPKSEKSLLVGAGGVLQRKPSKNQTQFKPKDISIRSTIGFGREKTTAFDVSMESEDFRKNWKIKTNSSQSFISPAKPNETRRSSERSIQDSSLAVECGYCLTHKKKADILTEKCMKLQQQYNAKVQALKDLTRKYDGIVKEKTQLCQKLQKTIESLHTKEEQLFRAREQMTHRIESYKKDVMRLTENIKYNQIEKSMLLRFKNDFALLSKECEQLKYQNDQYKKQLIAQANRQHGYSFTKRHQGSPQPPSHFGKKGQQNNIYYDCEDDSVSLNFSEHSYDYP